MKKILIVLLALCILMTGSVMAKKYSAAPSGQGLSTIGTGGDYATLGEASLDFNSTANTGNWTMEILGDLTEPSNIAFGNEVLSTSTILVKPATGVTATVTFSTTTDNTGPSGNFIVGSNTINAYTLFTINNFIIDGSNNGSTTRNLTFQTSTALVGYVYLIRSIGQTPNFQVKNCNVIANGGTASSNYAVMLSARKVSGQAMRADNAQIINNYLVCTACWSGQGIGFGITSFTAAVDTSINNFNISDNTIFARTRGIFLNGAHSGRVANNVISVRQTDSGYASTGIWHYSANGRGDWTIDIIGNKVTDLYSANSSAGAYGLTALDLTIVGGTYNVINNMIGGFNFGAPVVYGNILCRGISGTAANYTLYNNSVNIDNFPVLTAETTTYCFGIGNVSSTATTSVIMKNNIVRVNQAGGIALYAGSSTLALTSDYNDLYAGTNAYTARMVSTVFNTLADWTAAVAKDVNSQAVDPTATSPSKWVSSSNLHFDPFVATASASPLTAGTPIVGVTTDIDGQTRSVSAPWKGCDELFTAPVINPTFILGHPGDAAITVSVTGGTAPFTWNLSSGTLGTLSATTGASIQFTPGSVSATGTLTVTDSSSPTQTAYIPIQVTPTSAPLAAELME